MKKPNVFEKSRVFKNATVYGAVVSIFLSVSSTGISADKKDPAPRPNKSKMKTLAKHRTLARFEGEKYRLCRGLTALCPERCGDSGEFATFSIVDYLHYEKPGKYGDAPQKQFSFQVSDFKRKSILDAKKTKQMDAIRKGDVVLLEWHHLYGEIAPGLISPTRPVMELRKVSNAEAKLLKEGK